MVVIKQTLVTKISLMTINEPVTVGSHLYFSVLLREHLVMVMVFKIEAENDRKL